MTLDDKQLYDITLALAGIAQAACLVKELAQTGKMDETAYQASIASVFQMNPPNVLAVYGGHLAGIKLGLTELDTVLGSSTVPPQARYMLGLIRLQKKISGSKKILRLLTQRLDQAQKQVDYFSLLHPTVISNLADIYMKTISAFKFRIIIWGHQRILIAPENMEKIRAILLAGVRASVLWRQVGGSRFQLIFSRAKIRHMAKKILAEIT